MHVQIRPLKEKDAHISVKWRNDPDVWKYTAYSWTHEITLQDELNWIRAALADQTGRRFGIMADGTYVGNIYLTQMKDAEAEYSIFIGERSYWGKGIARAASQQLIQYAKQELQLTSLRLGVSEANLAAVHLYSSLGFVPYDKDDKFTWMRLDLGTQ